jgi:hypothetical protein
VKRLVRALATTTGLTVLLAGGWAVDFASLASLFPPRERQPAIEALVSHWPEPCTILVLGDELPPVKFELGLPLTEWPDPMHLEFGLSRTAFDSRVREQLAWMWEDSSSEHYEIAASRAAARAEHEGILHPARLALLYQRYRAAEVRTRLADIAHVVSWCAGLVVPPLMLLGIGRLRRERHASRTM